MNEADVLQQFEMLNQQCTATIRQSEVYVVAYELYQELKQNLIELNRLERELKLSPQKNRVNGK